MQWKSSFTALAAVALIAAVLGCGMDGPAPADNKGADNKSAGGNAGRASPASTAASYNNLKQISLAMQNYASTYSNAFPSAASIKNGNPYCSWRVKLLPFLEESNLYRQYHMDEPWDSPHNLEVAKTIPKVYQSPGRPVDGKTCYMVFAGKGAPFDISKFPTNNVPLASFADGTSHTILVVEAGPEKAVPWTKPEDLPFDPANPRAALGQIAEEGILAAMADGSVQRVNVDNATLKALITPAGGENIDMRKITGGQ